MNRSVSRFLAYSLVLAAFVGCGPKLTDEEKAQLRLVQVRQLIANNQLNQAKLEIDSIHSLHRMQVNERRVAAHLADSIVCIESLRTIAYCDSMLVIKQAEKAELIKQFRLEKNEQYQTEGNYVNRLLRTESNAERCYLQAYVTESSDVYLKSTYCGTFKVEHTHLTLSSNEITVSSPALAYSDAANHTFSDGGLTWETLSYKNDDALALLNFISANQDQRIAVSLGGKRKYNYTLMQSEKKALGATYHFGVVMRDIAQLEQEVFKAKRRIEQIDRK